MRAVYSEQALQSTLSCECAVLDVSTYSTSALQPASVSPLTTLNPAFEKLVRSVLASCSLYLMDLHILLSGQEARKHILVSDLNHILSDLKNSRFVYISK